MGWTATDPVFAALDGPCTGVLDGLAPMTVPAGSVLFSPGESVRGYVVVLEGRVDVHLVGPTGRDILLYQVAPGQSCIQSTLGLLGGDDYTAEALTVSDTRLVLIPRATFLALLDSSPGFRRIVFEAFAARMQNMMQLVENVSFMSVEQRLAVLLLDRADKAGRLGMTQADMAIAIGSAREVVSRRLEKMTRAGLIEHGRGEVRLLDPKGLADIARGPAV